MSSATVRAGAPQKKSKLLRILAVMGPAFVVGAWQFGPGNLTSAVQAGGRFGYSLIWLIALSTVLMLAFTDMSVRIALNSQGSLVETVKKVLGNWVGVVAGIGVFLITLMFSVGNAAGSGLGLAMLFGGNPAVWTAVVTLVVAAVVFLPNTYRLIERVLLAVVALMAFGFVASAFLTNPDWGAAAGGLVPTIPAGVGLLLVALVGTNFSINAAFYTGYATRERGMKKDQYADITLGDTVPGILAPGIMTIMVIIVAAAATGKTGAAPGTLQQLASVLEPLAGRFGSLVFALGFFGAAFSSMIANSTAGGTLLSDGLGWGNKVANMRVKMLIMLVLAFGMLVTVLAGSSPIQLIIVAQSLTVIVAPVLGILLILLANNKNLMGEMRNKWWQNLLAAAGMLAILATCYRLALGLLGS